MSNLNINFWIDSANLIAKLAARTCFDYKISTFAVVLTI
jgi:hypothetical protein